MMYRLSAASILLLLYFSAIKHYCKDDTEKFSFVLVSNAVKFLGLFTAVTCFYVVVTIVARMDNTTIQALRFYEHLIDRFGTLLKHLKLTPSTSFVILVAAFLLNLAADAVVFFRPYKNRIERVYALVEKYSRWLSRLTVTVTLLGSFTFLGGIAAQEKPELKVAIKDLRKKGEEFCSSVRNELQSRIAANITSKLPFALPALRPSWDIRDKIDRKQDELTSAKEAATRYEARSTAADELFSSFKVREKELGSLQDGDYPSRASGRLPMRKYENLLSRAKLVRLRDQIETYVQRSAKSASDTFKTPLGARIVPTIVKALLSESHITAVQNLTTNIPIAGALLSVFTDSVRTKVSSLIDKATDRIAASSLSNEKTSLTAELDSSASEIAKNVLEDISAQPTPDFSAEQVAALRDLETIDGAKLELEGRVEYQKFLIGKRNKVLLDALRLRSVAPISKIGTSRLAHAKRPGPSDFTDFANGRGKPLPFPSMDETAKNARAPDLNQLGTDFGALESRSMGGSTKERDPEFEDIITAPRPTQAVNDAIEKLITAAAGITDPLDQNRALTLIKVAVLARANLQASMAAQAAETIAPNSAASAELKELAANLRAIDAHSSLRTTIETRRYLLHEFEHPVERPIEVPRR